MRGIKPKLYDCGQHGMLTAKQIASMSGASATAIHKRLENGLRGEQLLARRLPSHKNSGQRREFWSARKPYQSRAFEFAIAVLRSFPADGQRSPTREWLMDRYGMSRAQAYRYIAAYKAATGKY